MKKVVLIIAMITSFNVYSFNVREPGIACAVAGAVAMFVFDQDAMMTGATCAVAAAAQPMLENHYRQKHSREYREAIAEQQNIIDRYKNLSWVRGDRLNEPQYIIEERIIPGRQTGTSIRSESREYRFSLPDTSGTAIGE